MEPVSVSIALGAVGSAGYVAYRQWFDDPENEKTGDSETDQKTETDKLNEKKANTTTDLSGKQSNHAVIAKKGSQINFDPADLESGTASGVGWNQGGKSETVNMNKAQQGSDLMGKSIGIRQLDKKKDKMRRNSLGNDRNIGVSIRGGHTSSSEEQAAAKAEKQHAVEVMSNRNRGAMRSGGLNASNLG